MDRNNYISGKVVGTSLANLLEGGDSENEPKVRKISACTDLYRSNFRFFDHKRKITT